MRSAILVPIVALLLSACSGAIHKEFPIANKAPVAISVDARQRMIFVEPERGAADSTYRRYCAEPSPDVFTVLGVAASGGATLGLDSDARSLNAALQAAFSSSEAGSTIPRTQTVNMLREMMYRTCERYLSGAISKEQFQTIAARDQRIMVSVLAIEQLTGSITPSAVALTSSGNAATGFDPAQTAKALADQQAKVVAADANVTAKKAALASVDTPAGSCATDASKLAACTKAQGDVTAATDALDASKAVYQGMLNMASRGLGVSSAATSTSVDFASNAARAQTVASVADTVRNIVDMTFKQDETLLFCLQVLDSDRLKDVREKCLQYLATKVAADERALAAGRTVLTSRERVAAPLRICFVAPGNNASVKAAVATVLTNAAAADAFIKDVQKSDRDALDALDDLGSANQTRMIAAVGATCGLGGL